MSKKKLKSIIDDRITIDSLSEDEQLAVISEIKNLKDTWKNAFMSKKEEIKTDRQAIWGTIDGHKSIDDDEVDDKGLPICLNVYLTAKGRLVNAIFPTQELDLRTLPVSEDDVEHLPFVSDYTKFVLSDINFMSSCSKWIGAALRDTYGILKVNWERDERLVYKPVTKGIYEDEVIVDQQSGIATTIQRLVKEEVEYKQVKEVVYNNPSTEIVDIMDIYFNPHSASFDKTELLQEKFITIAELHKYSVYSNISKIEKMQLEKRITKELDNSDKQQANTDNNLAENTTNYENIKIWHYYGDIKIERDNGKIVYLQNYVATIAEEEVLLQLEPNPDYTGRKHPYHMITTFIDPLNIGNCKSLTAEIKHLQMHIKDLFKDFTQATKKELKGQWIGEDGSISEEEMQNLKRGDAFVLLMDQPEKLTKLPPSADLVSMIKIIQWLEDYLQKTVGMTNVVTGEKDSSNRTATEHSLRAQALEERLTDILRNMQKPLEQAVRNIFDYCKMFHDEDLKMRFLKGDQAKFKTYRRALIESTRYDFQIKAIGSSIQRADEESRLTKAIQAANSSPILNKINIVELYKQYFSLMRLDPGLISNEVLVPESQAHNNAVQFGTALLSQTKGVPPNPMIQQQAQQAYSMYMQSQQQGQQAQQGAMQ